MGRMSELAIEEQDQREREDARLFAEWQYGRLYPDEAPALDFGADFDPAELAAGDDDDTFEFNPPGTAATRSATADTDTFDLDSPYQTGQDLDSPW